MSLRTFCIVIILLVIGSLNAEWSQAATYYVAKTGSDSNSCATAATAASDSTKAKRNIRGAAGGMACLAAGDTLDIRAGTYNELITPSGIGFTFVSGTAATPITIKGHAGETVIVGMINMTLASGDWYVFDNLTVDGDILGMSSCNCNPAFSTARDNITLKNSIVKNGGSQGIAGDQAAAFNTFRNVEIFDNGQAGDPHNGYGIYWRGDDTLFEYMNIHDNPGYGVHIYQSGGGPERNTVRYSKIYTNGGSEGSQFGLLLSGGSGHKAYGNLVYGNTGGIDVSYQCTDCLVYNNTVYNNNIIRGNIKVSNNYDGIHIGTGINTIIKNNILYGNYGSNTVNTATGTNTTASNNLSTNPQFVNAGIGDFHLQAGSPAIGAGTAIPGITIMDFSGAALPQSASIDIGAFQSKVNSVSPPPAPSSLAIGFLP